MKMKIKRVKKTYDEHAEEKIIIHALQRTPGMVAKINQGGRPLMGKDGKVKKLIPFGNSFYSLPDIFYADKGGVWFFEVKNPNKLKKWAILERSNDLEKYLFEIEVRMRIDNPNKKYSDYRQYCFMRDAVKQGLFACYVSYLEDVQNAFNQRPSYLWFR